MSTDRKSPEAVYFDSNVLRKAGWPDPSAQLLELLSKLAGASVQPCLVDLVREELTESWIRDLVRDRSSLASKSKDWCRRSLGLGSVEAPAALPTVEEMRKHLAHATAKLTSLFRAVPTTTQPTAFFTRLAMSRGGAFVEGGKGFNDTVILISALEDMEKHGVESALFVSADGGFKPEGMNQVTRGKDLRIAQDFETVDKMVDQLVSQRVHAYISEKKKMLLSAVEAHRTELRDFLRQHLTLTREDLKTADQVLKVEFLEIIKLEDAHSSPFELGQENRDENRISVDVNVRVRVDTVTFSFEAMLGQEPRPFGPEDSMITSREHVALVTVEATVEVSKRGIEAFKFLRVYSKRRSRFGDLFSGLIKADGA